MMSFTSFIALQVDKESDLFGQSSNDSSNDFLDQFLTLDMADSESSNLLSGPGLTLSVKPSSGSESKGASFSLWEDEARLDFTQDQPGEPDNIGTALFLDIPKGSSKTRITAGSGSELLSLEKISHRSPRLDFSPPSSPKPAIVESVRGRRRFIERLAKPFRTDPNISEQRKSSPIRKTTSPAKMMRTSQYSGQIIPDWEKLALDAPKFEFGFQSGSRPISPPPCPRAFGGSEVDNMLSSTQDHDNFGWDHPLPQSYLRRAQDNAVSYLTTPPSDVITFQQANALHNSTTDIVYASPHRSHTSASWTQPPVPSDFSFDTSTAYTLCGKTIPLWHGNAPTTNLAQPPALDFSRSPSQHKTSLAMPLQADLAYNANDLGLTQSNVPSGLMIQNLPRTPIQQSFTVGSLQPGQEQGRFAQLRSTASQVSQPQSHHHHHHRYTQSQPQPPFSEFTSPKIHHDKSHTRNGSSSSPSPKSRSSSSHVSKRRSRSFCQKRSTVDNASVPKTPRTPNADFVNFTPDDSMKILTGVAPSGSSKTKARREKEAMEKTRRLSQAALRAVQAAGGSIQGLVEEGLIAPLKDH